MRGWGIFLLGGAVGAVVAALCAPRTGHEARAELRSRIADGLGEVKAGTRLRVTELMRAGRDAVQGARGRQEAREEAAGTAEAEPAPLPVR